MGRYSGCGCRGSRSNSLVVCGLFGFAQGFVDDHLEIGLVAESSLVA